jgi:predicted amidohydrolase YtcJ
MTQFGPTAIFTNGTILTADDQDREAEAVALAGNRIAAVGSASDIMRLRGPKTEVFDLKGRTLMPGLTDPHVHLADDGTSMLAAVDVRDFYTNTRSVAQILEQVRERAGTTKPGAWVVGLGSPMQDFRSAEGRFPTREELDRVAPDHPAVIGFGAHITIANSRALALAGIDRHTPDPGGGHIDHHPETGELTGLLLERAQLLVRKPIGPDVPVGFNPNTPSANMKEGILFAARRSLARGVTSIHDIVMNANTIRAYQELAAEGRMPVRASMLIRVIEAAIRPESLINLGLMTNFGNEWLKIGGVKMSIDGGITGRAAAFSEPYADNACNCGLIRIPAEELERTVDLYHQAGHRVCVHAIGDVGMDMALAALEKAITKTPRANHRHRVEHLGNWMITPERLKTIRDLDLLPVPNITFMHYIYDSLIACMGPERLRGAFGLKTMIAAGIKLTSGSDGPGYWPSDPLRDLGVSVSRRTWKGQEIGPEEAVSVAEAIRMYTINAAYNGFDETIKGSVEPGKLADFAILESNPFHAGKDRIGDIPVDMTILDGKPVYTREGVGELRV